MPDNEVPVNQPAPLAHDDPHLTARIAAHEREVEYLRKQVHENGSKELARDLRIAEINLNLGYQDKQLAKIVTHLEGNGKPGLITRIDRLEQTEGERKILRRTIAGSIVTSTVGFCFYLFKAFALGGHK